MFKKKNFLFMAALVVAQYACLKLAALFPTQGAILLLVNLLTLGTVAIMLHLEELFQEGVSARLPEQLNETAKYATLPFHAINAIMNTRFRPFEVYAVLLRGYDATDGHVIEPGTNVRIWMASRFGDIGITDNLENPIGYNVRGVKASDLGAIYVKRVKHFSEYAKYPV